MIKKIIVSIIMLVVVIYSNNVNASNDTGFRFDWKVISVDVPLNSSIEDYKNNFVVNAYVDGRQLSSDEYYVHLGVNGTSLTTVNTSKVGKYKVDVIIQLFNYSSASSENTITYNVYDSDGPDLTVTETLITTVYNIKPDYLNFVRTYDNSSTVSVTVDESRVLYSFVGVYPVVITAKDGSGNYKSLIINVEVIDPFAPRISLVNPLELALGEEINVEYYFYGYDDYDKVITNRIVIENFDKDKAGTQYIYVSLSDLAGNEVRMPFTVNVSDKTKPIILFNTLDAKVDVASDLTIELFRQFILNVTDDGKYLNNNDVSIDFSTVLNELGTYKVIYTISDSSDNEAEFELLVSVVQTKGPSISYTDITLKSGEVFNSSLITDYISVNDDFDDTAYSTLKVDYSGVNFAVPGTYAVIITACNSSGVFTYETMLITIEGNGVNGILQYWPLTLIAIAPIGYVIYLKYKKKQELAYED